MAVYDEVTLCNMALSNLGIGQRITALSDLKDTAKACRLWYDPTRDLMLSTFDWMVSRRKITLNLVEEDPDGADGEWKYSYRYPDTCIVARRIVVPGIGLPEASAQPFQVGRDDTGRLVFTDQEDAVLECTAFNEDEGEWNDTFAQAFAWTLAKNICPELTVDPGKAANAEATSERMMRTARGTSNQEQRRTDPTPSVFISSRF